MSLQRSSLTWPRAASSKLRAEPQKFGESHCGFGRLVTLLEMLGKKLGAGGGTPSGCGPPSPSSRPRAERRGSDPDGGFRTAAWATARDKCFNPTFAAQPARARAEKPAVFIRLQQHDYFVGYYLILRYAVFLPGAGCVKANRSDFRANINSPVNPLLIRCYSAVIPLLIPLLFRCYFHCQGRQFIPQIPEPANVFETEFRKKRLHRNFFSCEQRNLGFQQAGIHPR
jgi:hypothetical protein